MWFHVSPSSAETLLLFDNGRGEEEAMEGKRIMVFGSKDHLKLLIRSLDWMGDGTFDKTPRVGKQKFHQLVREGFI